MKTRKNNKGFSLVELIVVVAIMAVLVGVLAPAYLKYVENSRTQKDVSAVGEVVQAVKIAAANENVSKEIGTTAIEITFDTAGSPTTTAANDALEKELDATVGTVKFTSKAFTETAPKVSVSAAADGSLVVTVSGPQALVDAFAS